MRNPDFIGEMALIEMSRLQRETLERWVAVLADAGEVEHAERLRSEITEPELERAAA